MHDPLWMERPLRAVGGWPARRGTGAFRNRRQRGRRGARWTEVLVDAKAACRCSHACCGAGCGGATGVHGSAGARAPGRGRRATASRPTRDPESTTFGAVPVSTHGCAAGVVIFWFSADTDHASNPTYGGAGASNSTDASRRAPHGVVRQPPVAAVHRAPTTALSEQRVNGCGNVGQRRGVVKAGDRLATLVK